jgi:MoaA/NifB/PqqE/SkfB family radical SAM enzyme
LFSYQTVHIELSSKCVLKCPRCPRTELAFDTINQEVSLQDFIKGFPASTLDSIEQLLFCGDIGDPIYATEFLDIVAYIKNNSKIRLKIVTNGSYKKLQWWQQLGTMLDVNDCVTFSVDGWDNESNNKYRINSDFESIIAGIGALRNASACTIIWSTIYFSFNQEHIDLIRKTAADLGCNLFQTVKSSKFDHRYLVNNVDKLKPRLDLVAKNLVYDTSIEVLNANGHCALQKPQPVLPHAWARCLNYQKDLYIGVDGLLAPCPWFNNGYQTNDFVQQNRERLSIKNRSFFEILNDQELWQELLRRFDIDPPEICKLKCKNGQQ